MSSTSLIKKFQNEVELTPVKGASHIHVIHPNYPVESASMDAEITEADWDKFEADIDEAFEKTP